jgi:hypothetical protein
MAARSKAKVYGRSPAEIVGSNPTRGINVCLLWGLSGRDLCDELIARPGVLPTVMRSCVWSWKLVNEEAMAHWGSLYQNKYKLERVDKFVKLSKVSTQRKYSDGRMDRRKVQTQRPEGKFRSTRLKL